MAIDAVLVLPPLRSDLLRRLLERAPAATVLGDGGALVPLGVAFCEVLDRPDEGLAAVGAYADLLGEDPRGALVYPDVCRVLPRSYAAVVAFVARSGTWLPVGSLRATVRPCA